MNTENITCYSGGADGTDLLFENLCLKNGINMMAFSFNSHSCNSKCRIILDHNKLVEADPWLNTANRLLNRTVPYNKYYVMNLLRRNYHQVKNTDIVYAVTSIDENIIPRGGTAWAIVIGTILSKPTYVYDQITHFWNKWDFTKGIWAEITSDMVPVIKENLRFTGIGTRELEENGMNAILELFTRSGLII